MSCPPSRYRQPPGHLSDVHLRCRQRAGQARGPLDRRPDLLFDLRSVGDCGWASGGIVLRCGVLAEYGIGTPLRGAPSSSSSSRKVARSVLSNIVSSQVWISSDSSPCSPVRSSLPTSRGAASRTSSGSWASSTRVPVLRPGAHPRRAPSPRQPHFRQPPGQPGPRQPLSVSSRRVGSPCSPSLVDNRASTS